MNKVAVIYWSGTGNTEAMAEAVVEGIKEEGAEVELIFSDDFEKDMMNEFDTFAFGCPAMGDENLEELSFEPMFESIEDLLEGKKIAIFGSYEWNDGEWMESWKERVLDAGAELSFEPLAVYDYPDEESIEKCKELGKSLV